MNAKDFKEIGSAAVVTSLLVYGALAVRPGASIDPQTGFVPRVPVASVGMCAVSGSATADAAKGTIISDVRVTNSTAQPQGAKFTVVLARQQYVGNPGSRVMLPTDYKQVQVGQRFLAVSVPGGASRDIILTFPLNKSSAQVPSVPSSSYHLDIVWSGQRVSIASARDASPRIVAQQASAVAGSTTN